MRLVDADGDGMITMDEAENVGLMTNRKDRNQSIFAYNKTIVSFREFAYFRNLKNCNSIFEGCTSLKYVELPPVKELSGSFFKYTLIEKIVVPEGVETIGNGFAWNCNQLKLLSLPSTIKTLTTNNSLISGATNLIIISKALTPPDFPGSLGVNPLAIYVPDSSMDAYKVATTWSKYTSVIKPLSEYAG